MGQEELIKAIEVAISLIGILAATMIGVLQFQRKAALRRTKLKNDLEVLEISKRLNFEVDDFEKNIASRFKSYHSESHNELNIEFIAVAIGGGIVTIGFGLGTVYILQDGFTWWSILTGYIALFGIVIPVNYYHDKVKEKVKPQEKVDELESKKQELKKD